MGAHQVMLGSHRAEWSVAG